MGSLTPGRIRPVDFDATVSGLSITELVGRAGSSFFHNEHDDNKTVDKERNAKGKEMDFIVPVLAGSNKTDYLR